MCRRSSMSVTIKHLDAANSFFSAFNNHEVEKMLAVCAKDAKLRFVPMGEAGEGEVRELGKGFWLTLFDAVEGVNVVVQSVFGDERKVAAEVVVGGKQKKE